MWYTDVILHGSEQRYDTDENSRLNRIVQQFIEAANRLSHVKMHPLLS